MDDINYNPDDIKLNFHPCDTPRGFSYYNLDELSYTERKELNERKIQHIRENNQYLGKHPEIRAVILAILNKVLSDRPKVNVLKFVSNYVKKSFIEIHTAVDKYIQEHHLVPYQSIDHEVCDSKDSKTELKLDICMRILDSILLKATSETYILKSKYQHYYSVVSYGSLSTTRTSADYVSALDDDVTVHDDMSMLERYLRQRRLEGQQENEGER